MKKFTMFAAAAFVAMAANAQYTVNPETSVVAAQGPKTVEYLVLPDASIEELQAAGATCKYIGPDDVTRFLYIWDETMTGGDGSYPGVDFQEGEYPSLVVGSVGWSGAGYFISQDDNCDLSMFNENTRFHIAYRTPSGTGPASIALIILDGDNSSPAKVAVGEAFIDGGATYPTIGPAINDDWQGIDISFADLKKLYPSFDLGQLNPWYGNILSFLGGGVAGQTFAFDTVYFYNVDENSEEPGEEPSDAPEALYMIGDGIGWTPEAPLAATSSENGVFTFSNVTLTGEPAYFSFINTINADWGVINDGEHRYGPAEGTDAAITVGTTEFEMGGDTSWNIAGGTYDFVVNFNNMTLTVNSADAAVEGLAADNSWFFYTGNTINLNNANGIQLYNLNGQLVKSTNGCVLGTTDLSSGVYVARSGNKTMKVVVK